MKRTPLRRVSKKHAAELKTYYLLRKMFLSQKLYCEIPSRTASLSCLNYASEVHHSKGRGKLLNEMKFWYASCIECHRFLHDNPKWAREHNLLP